MRVTLDDIRRKVDALCKGEETREAVADFASQAIRADDQCNLELEPEHREKTWDAIKYLLSADSQVAPDSYFFAIADFEDYRKRAGI